MKGYSDGYKDVPRTSQEKEYLDGYRRGLTDGLMDCKIICKPKVKSIFDN